MYFSLTRCPSFPARGGGWKWGFYYLALYAAHAPHTTEDVGEWREGVDHDAYRILQGFMESVAATIKDGSFVTHEDGAACIDLFCIPQWFYEEVMQKSIEI